MDAENIGCTKLKNVDTEKVKYIEAAITEAENLKAKNKSEFKKIENDIKVSNRVENYQIKSGPNDYDLTLNIIPPREGNVNIVDTLNKVLEDLPIEEIHYDNLNAFREKKLEGKGKIEIRRKLIEINNQLFKTLESILSFLLECKHSDCDMKIKAVVAYLNNICGFLNDLIYSEHYEENLNVDNFKSSLNVFLKYFKSLKEEKNSNVLEKLTDLLLNLDDLDNKLEGIHERVNLYNATKKNKYSPILIVDIIRNFLNSDSGIKRFPLERDRLEKELEGISACVKNYHITMLRDCKTGKLISSNGVRKEISSIQSIQRDKLNFPELEKLIERLSGALDQRGVKLEKLKLYYKTPIKKIHKDSCSKIQEAISYWIDACESDELKCILGEFNKLLKVYIVADDEKKRAAKLDYNIQTLSKLKEESNKTIGHFLVVLFYIFNQIYFEKDEQDQFVTLISSLLVYIESHAEILDKVKDEEFDFKSADSLESNCHCCCDAMSKIFKFFKIITVENATNSQQFYLSHWECENPKKAPSGFGSFDNLSVNNEVNNSNQYQQFAQISFNPFSSYNQLVDLSRQQFKNQSQQQSMIQLQQEQNTRNPYDSMNPPSGNLMNSYFLNKRQELQEEEKE
ncbi:MAG: hypothetical protein N4A49_08205 [Marinifilaceae bacterium]|nr:hypothetical protein [Marinifilaceae bacterium]